MVSFNSALAGTSVDEWAGALDDVPELNLDGVTKVVVVAAHPDDETLGAGGLIAECATRGVDVSVIVVTDGSGSHPDSPSHTPGELALMRAHEVTAAVALLAPAATLHLLWFADGKVNEHRDEIAAELAKLTEGADLVVAPWRGDGHRDHRVVGELCANLGARLLEYPIWMWHWGTPDHTDVPLDRFVKLSANKSDAIATHASQVEPLSDEPGDEAMLTREFLEHFATGTEYFIEPEKSTAPAEDTESADNTAHPTSLGVTYFDDLYERHSDPWEFESRWYERRKRAITVASLPRERYARALEIGCSIGVLSEDLSARVDELLAVDLSTAAIDRARNRELPNVNFAVMDVAAAFPDGEFDLIVLSEVGYYLSSDDLARLLDNARSHLSPGGTLLACHWRHPVADYPLSGDEVHAAIDLPRLVRHEEDDFVLEVFCLEPASVAAREGLL